ncbi:MAG: HAD family hydrolase [Firmicutes bacterium]|nr:HAD family hydrolase [Bacillota bacterium]
MAVTTVLFDLDGTLLGMDQDKFTNAYFSLMAKKMCAFGYDPDLLIKNIWKGTAMMVMNNGTHTNEEVFWSFFESVYPGKSKEDYPKFEEFYRNEFQRVEGICDSHKEANDIVQLCKKLGFRVALATNPIFPSVATESRIRWAGLDIEDFELVTTYENSYSSKPNPQYYVEVCTKLGVKPEECLMIGNDVEEDMVAQKLGMKVFLLTNDMINKKEKDISQYPNGDFEALKSFFRDIA